MCVVLVGGTSSRTISILTAEVSFDSHIYYRMSFTLFCGLWWRHGSPQLVAGARSVLTCLHLLLAWVLDGGRSWSQPQPRWLGLQQKLVRGTRKLAGSRGSGRNLIGLLILRSLNTGFTEMGALVRDFDFDVFGVPEDRLRPGTPSDNYNIPDCSMLVIAMPGPVHLTMVRKQVEVLPCT